jgi:hypothetical protein
VAGGQYSGSGGGGFVAAERNGRWGRATLVPGLAALGGGAVTSVSCGSAGNCAAGGIYEGRLIGFRGFVVSQRNGVWGQAIEVPGPLNAGGVSQVLSVSCGAAGNCTAGGFYAASSGQQGFVVSQRDGVWRQAIELPGPGDVSPDGSATVFAVSCASAGTCTAGGQYTNASGDAEGFVVSRRNGSWRRVMVISGPGTPWADTSPYVWSVSCPSAGNCTAGGLYADRHYQAQVFLVSERNGQWLWRRAIEVHEPGALSLGGLLHLSSVSCSSAGNCAAGGWYLDASHDYQGFLVSQRNGGWGPTIDLLAP